MNDRIESNSKKIERLLKEILETNRREREQDRSAPVYEVNQLEARLERIANGRAELDGQDLSARRPFLQHVEQGDYLITTYSE